MFLFAAGKKCSLYASFLTAGVIILVVFMLLSHSLTVSAIRPFPGDFHNASRNNTINNNYNVDDLLAKYFNGRSYKFMSNSSTVLNDSKRRVPSCPDPLHNK
ncbi:unnamed protein product [Amaranthus hypochondriacus]